MALPATPLTDLLMRAAYLGNLVLDTESGRYYRLDTCGSPDDRQTLADGDVIGVGCPCGKRPQYGNAADGIETEHINDLIARGDLAAAGTVGPGLIRIGGTR
jgi:hypothetical protein